MRARRWSTPPGGAAAARGGRRLQKRMGHCMLMLQRLRQLLRTAENSVVIGFSGTPLSDTGAVKESSALMG